jgi:hypothetical protein
MKDIAIFLYCESDTMALPWAENGVECHLFDLMNPETQKGNIHYHGGYIQDRRRLLGKLCRENNVLAGISFTPCNDMSVAGAKHFEKKALNDAYFWAKAYELTCIGVDLFEFFGIPYMVENPKTVLATLWRSPDHVFNPYEYGGYLTPDHQHRYYPDIYPPRDAYHKETWIWTGNGFRMPKKIPVPPAEKAFPGFKKLGGKSERTKQIRSVTPEGFAKAVLLANYIPFYQLFKEAI